MNNNKFYISDNDFKYYLAGLFEGFGHILIPKSDGLPNLKHKALPRFYITAPAKDAPLIQFLLKQIGYGFIQEKKLNNVVVLTIGNRAGVLKIIE
jgi:hypothetical protein